MAISFVSFLLCIIAAADVRDFVFCLQNIIITFISICVLSHILFIFTTYRLSTCIHNITNQIVLKTLHLSFSFFFFLRPLICSFDTFIHLSTSTIFIYSFSFNISEYQNSFTRYIFYKSVIVETVTVHFFLS